MFNKKTIPQKMDLSKRNLNSTQRKNQELECKFERVGLHCIL